jgi:dihydrolipoamide dehydrogenase
VTFLVRVKDKITVTAEDGKTTDLEAKHIVIATGSDSAGIPGVALEIDEKTVVSSTGALELDKVPGHLVVVGGGVIGLELGSVWRRLGAKVTVVEFLDHILGAMDLDTSKQFLRILKKQGMEFMLSSKVTAVEKKGRKQLVTVEHAGGEADAETLEADVVLVSTGRVPYTKGLGLEEVGVELDERGRVKTDDHFKTNVDGIYAIGDVITRADAGPQGRRRRHGTGRADRRQGGPCEL